jgi:aryl-alcohol dehydrogenase-like predicted oxidoreductase
MLAGGAAEAQSRRLVKAALDAGLRHFDVAPTYGLGLAERALGSALAGRRAEVSLATKVGKQRPRYGQAATVVRSLMRPILSMTPDLKRRLGARTAGALTPKRQDFSLGFIRASLEDSLRSLRTDHVDLLLFHDIHPADVTDEVLRSAEDLQRAGKALEFGIATDAGPAHDIARQWPQLCRVVQTSWSPFSNAPPPRSDTLITYRILQPHLKPLLALLAHDPEARERANSIAKADLLQPGALAEVLLAGALADNPSGIVLVSTSRPERMGDYARIQNDTQLLGRAAALLAYLRSTEGPLDGV